MLIVDTVNTFQFPRISGNLWAEESASLPKYYKETFLPSIRGNSCNLSATTFGRRCDKVVPVNKPILQAFLCEIFRPKLDFRNKGCQCKNKI